MLFKMSNGYPFLTFQILPADLKRIMANVNSLDSFMKAFDLGNISLVPPPPPPRYWKQGGGMHLIDTKTKNYKRPKNAQLKSGKYSYQ